MAVQNAHEQAVKDAHDAELAELEAKVNAELAQANGEQTEQSGEETKTETSDSTSAGEETNQSSTDDATQTESQTEEQQTDPQNDDEDVPALSDDEVKLLSKKAQKRFAQLNAEKKALQEQLELRGKLNPQTRQPATKTNSSSNGLPWLQSQNNTQSQDGDVREVTPEEYTADVQKTAQGIVQQELAKEKILQNFQTDRQACETAYPELDPNSEDYDDSLAKRVTKFYYQAFKEDPTVRLKDFVDDLMTMRESAKAKAKQTITGKIVKQSAEQAVGNTSVKPQQKQTVDTLIKNANSIDELNKLESMINAA